MLSSTTLALQKLYIFGCVLCVIAGHLAFGLLTGGAALGASAGWAILLGLGLATLPTVANRSALTLVAPAALYGAVIVVALLSLTDFGWGTRQPIWDALGLPPASTLDKSETILEIVKLGGLSCAFLVGWLCGARTDLATTTVKALVFGLTLFGVVAIGIEIYGGAFGTQGGRLEALFLNPNTAATVFGAALCLSASLLVQALARRNVRWFTGQIVTSVLCSAVALTALLMTASRGGLAATGLALAVLITADALVRRRTARFIASQLSIIAILGGLMTAASGQVLNRVLAVEDDARLRGVIFDTYWQAFGEAPLMGYGLGSFDTMHRILLDQKTYANLWNIRAAENVYLQWLVEGGILATIPMFLCVGLIIVFSTLRTVRCKSRIAPLLGLLAADLVILLHGFVDFALQTPSVAFMWALVLGLQFSWSATQLREARS